MSQETARPNQTPSTGPAAGVRELTRPEVEALLDPILEVYRRAFLPPPYNKPEIEVAVFARSLPNHPQRAGFRFMAAFDPPGKMAGFAYGYTCRPGLWWYDLVRPALEAEAARWLEDAFQLAEIAVDPDYQGRGIGSRLHDRLLAGLPHARAVLTTLQAETAAHHLYRRRGWTVLREGFFFPGVDRPYQILGLDLTGDR